MIALVGSYLENYEVIHNFCMHHCIANLFCATCRFMKVWKAARFNPPHAPIKLSAAPNPNNNLR